MVHTKKIKLFGWVLFSCLLFILISCNDDIKGKTQEDCFKGLTDSQTVVVNKLIELLKDKSKITAASPFGFGIKEREGKDFSDAVTVSKYTSDYLDGLFKILDLTEFPVRDADRYFNKYVSEKYQSIKTAYPTADGAETKSVLVSTDSIYKLASQLITYQNITQRKTGIRVVFANYDDTNLGGVKKSGHLTYFMVGTVDTVSVGNNFNWQYQKDLTILSDSWSIPAWGLSAYNHGELCPNSCITGAACRPNPTISRTPGVVMIGTRSALSNRQKM